MKELLHNLFGAASNAGQLANGISNNAVYQPTNMEQRKSLNKKLFDGRIEVTQVANGYIVSIGRKEGYEYESHIAQSITEVNEIIAAQIVLFKLEN